VTSCMVHEAQWSKADAIVDHDGPDRHQGDEAVVYPHVQGQQERTDMIGQGLCKRIERMKRQAGQRRGLSKPVVEDMQVLVEKTGMQGAVDPIDAGFGDGQDGDNAAEQIGPTVFTEK
jgi:hypothetical protein